MVVYVVFDDEDGERGYDVRADGPSIIGHSSIARESSKSLLLVGDKKLLLDFPLEALHDMAVHNSASVCTILQHMRSIILEKEDLSYRAEADLAKTREKNRDLVSLCCQLNSEKVSAEVASGSSSIEVERLQKELSMHQECYTLLKREKEFISSSAYAEKSSLESSNSIL